MSSLFIYAFALVAVALVAVSLVAVCFANLLFKLAALFLWIMPRLANLSI